MYLSRLTLNPGSRKVRRELADLQQLHRTVMSGFPDSGDPQPRRAHGVLFRIEPFAQGPPQLLVQSQTEPRWQLDERLLPGTAPVTKEIGRLLELLATGDRCRFRLLANPTRKIARHTPDGERRRQGRRVELRTDAQLRDWLVRQGDRHGFGIPTGTASELDLLVTPLARQRGRRTSENEPVIAVGALYNGNLQVTEANLLRAAIRDGIGPAKAYGFGLLSLARA